MHKTYRILLTAQEEELPSTADPVSEESSFLRFRGVLHAGPKAAEEGLQRFHTYGKRELVSAERRLVLGQYGVGEKCEGYLETFSERFFRTQFLE